MDDEHAAPPLTWRALCVMVAVLGGLASCALAPVAVGVALWAQDGMSAIGAACQGLWGLVVVIALWDS